MTARQLRHLEEHLREFYAWLRDDVQGTLDQENVETTLVSVVVCATMLEHEERKAAGAQ